MEPTQPNPHGRPTEQTAAEIDMAVRRAFELTKARMAIKKLKTLTGTVPWIQLMECVSAPELLLLKSANDAASPPGAPAAPCLSSAPLEPPSFLRKSAILDMLQVSKSTLGNWRKEGGDYYDPTFPKPVYFNKGKTPHWLKEEILCWIKAQATKRAA